MFAARPVIVELVPVPVLVTAPGLRVNVHVPVDGKPFKTTLPVGVSQTGCVMVPTEGAGQELPVIVTDLKLVLKTTQLVPANKADFVCPTQLAVFTGEGLDTLPL